MLIRKFADADLNSIAQIMIDGERSWGIDTETISVAKERILFPEKHIWVGVMNYQIVGFAAWQPEKESVSPSIEAADTDAHLNSLYVAESQRGSGLVEKLHDKALQEAFQEGYLRIRLWAPEPAVAAQRFYLKNGYVLTSKSKSKVFIGLNRLEFRRNI